MTTTPRPPDGDWLGTPYLRFTREGPFGVCTLDRPQARNAMTPAMYFGIRYAVRHVDADPDLAGLLITGAGDVFAMPCRSRWGGLEQEGFGIVFVEAAAAGVPQVAGESGGAAEAVEHGTTGLVVDRPEDEGRLADSLVELLADDRRRAEMGRASRLRAVEEFSYDVLAERLRHDMDAAVLRGPSD